MTCITCDPVIPFLCIALIKKEWPSMGERTDGHADKWAPERKATCRSIAHFMPLRLRFKIQNVSAVETHRNTSRRAGPGRIHSLTGASAVSAMSASSGQTDNCYLVLSTFLFPFKKVFTLYSQRFWGGFTPRAFTRSSSMRIALRWLLLSMVYGALENSSSVRVKSNLGGQGWKQAFQSELYLINTNTHFGLEVRHLIYEVIWPTANK